MFPANQTPWGAPNQPDTGASWLSEYGPFLLIGILILIGVATSGEVTREKKRARR